HRPVMGFEADQAARAVVERAGLGDRFVHRTGHSIDRDLHGSGPHLDDYETHDDRTLVPGIGFSVEPGVYLPGEFGIRSEVNVFMGESGPEVTPRHPQTELITG
ncbi:MAG TPA: M24 family metallopeptidase, partial [Gemmatimonadales bacterium]|nr:M24 family metallopeptidase [Gemmatimonadales bacterium]